MRAKKLSTLIILLFTAALASATTRLVPAQYPNIQAAIDDCNDGDTVIVAPGTYTGPGNREISYKGKAITVRSTDPNDPNIVAQTIIDCQSSGRAFLLEHCGPAAIAGLTITNGYASYGGAVKCVNSTASITGCVLGNNNASDDGGAIYCVAGQTVIDNCRLSGNAAAKSGGAILCASGEMTLTNSNLTQNAAGWDGGALKCFWSNPWIAHSVISGNSSQTHGGGINIECGKNAVISNCLIAGNKATLSTGGGIAFIYTNDWPATNSAVINCTIVGNSAKGGYGGIYCHDSTPTVTNCILWGNGGPGIGTSPLPSVAYSNIEKGYSGRGNINSNPLFADTYHLSADSPCIDAGDPNYTPTPGETDIDAHPRLVGPSVDMGCDEFILNPSGSAIDVFPRELHFTVFEADPEPQPAIIQIWNSGIGEIAWSVTENCGWLRVNPAAGTATTAEVNGFTLDVDTIGMPWGVYDCNLTISDRFASNSPFTLPVRAEIIGPILSVDKSRFNFLACKENPTPAVETLSIQNAGAGTLSWQITVPNDCNWLSVYPLTGQSRGDVNEVVLTVDTSALADGFYRCNLTIDDPNAANRPQIVEVCLRVAFEQVWLYVPGEYPNIQAAIDWALPGDIVVIAPGTYTGPGNRDIDFRGKAITVQSIDPNNPAIVAATIIDCNGGLGNYHRGFDFHTSEDANSILAGFTIINGYADQGAGIRITAGRRGDPQTDPVKCRILNCIITRNTAAHDGGGVWILASSPTITNCTMRDNKSDYGGAICCYGSDAVITNCIFGGNSVRYNGGAIYSYHGNLSLTNATVTENSAKSRGGALYCYYSGKPTITNSILYYNAAPSGPEIALDSYIRDPSLLNLAVSYNNIRGGLPAIYNPGRAIISWGPGNIEAEPYFVDANSGDYHLKSGGWRWDAQRKTWTWDTVTSRCIDAGDPDAPLRDELLFVSVDPTGYWGANFRINMGAYGGTTEASIPPHGWAIRTDYSNDGIANFTDFAYWTKSHPYTTGEPLGALNPSPALEPIGLSILGADWLDQTTWFQMPGQATTPNPPDGSVGIRLDPVLGWQAGAGATSHDVYFGTSDPPTFQASTTARTFAPGYLSKNTTYYWRIDEVNSFGKTPGPLWTFTTTSWPSR